MMKNVDKINLYIDKLIKNQAYFKEFTFLIL